MSYDLEASVKKLRCMIKIIHFFIHGLLLFSNEFIYPLGKSWSKSNQKLFIWFIIILWYSWMQSITSLCLQVGQ